MKAAIRDDRGLAFADRPCPTPGPEDVLVRVRAVALNRADLGVLTGHMHGKIGGSGTVVGMEFAGEVASVGAQVSTLQPGDPVMGFSAGAFAGYVRADYGCVYPVPAGMGFEQAATLPVGLQTMHDALIVNGRLKAGESVLILGASSGVGLMAQRIARKMGAGLVIGSSTRADRRARLGEFGADLVIDSADPAWPDVAREATGGKGVDLIIDQLSGATVNASMMAAAVRARIVNVGRLAGARAEFDFDLHALKRIDYIGVTHRTRSLAELREECRKTWEDLASSVADGSLALPISATFPFKRLGEAFDTMRSNRHFGKIIVTLS